MTHTSIATGHNLNTICYNYLIHQYAPLQEPSSCFCAEEGKEALYALGHFANIVVIAPISIIYDLAMAVFFLLANIATGFTICSLRQRLLDRLKSIGMETPVDIGKNLLSIVLPRACWNPGQTPPPPSDLDRLNTQLHQHHQRFDSSADQLEEERNGTPLMQETLYLRIRSNAEQRLIARATQAQAGDPAAREAIEAYVNALLKEHVAQYISDTRQTHQNLTTSDEQFLDALSRCNTLEEIIQCKANRTGLASIDLPTHVLKTYLPPICVNQRNPFLTLQTETAAFLQQLAQFNPQTDAEALDQFLNSYTSEQKTAFNQDVTRVEQAFTQMTAVLAVDQPGANIVSFALGDQDSLWCTDKFIRPSVVYADLPTSSASSNANNSPRFLILKPETAAYMQQLAGLHPLRDLSTVDQRLNSYTPAQQAAFTQDFKNAERAFAQIINSSIILRQPVGMAIYFIPKNEQLIRPADDSPEMARWIRTCRDPQLTRQFLDAFRSRLTQECEQIGISGGDQYDLNLFWSNADLFFSTNTTSIVLPYFINHVSDLLFTHLSEDLKACVANVWNDLIRHPGLENSSAL